MLFIYTKSPTPSLFTSLSLSLFPISLYLDLSSARDQSFKIFRKRLIVELPRNFTTFCLSITKTSLIFGNFSPITTSMIESVALVLLSSLLVSTIISHAGCNKSVAISLRCSTSMTKHSRSS